LVKTAGLALAWAAVLALIFVALRDIPLAQTAAALARLTGWQIGALVLFNLAILGGMAGRWWLLLRSLGWRVSFPVLLGYRLAGFSVSYFTPGPQFGGEPVQVALLHRRQGVPLPAAIASVAADRLVDLLGNFTFLAVGSLVLVAGGRLGGQVWLLSVALLLIPVLHLAALWGGKRPVTRLAAGLHLRLARPLTARVAQVAGQAEAEVADMLRRRPGSFLLAVGLSALVWLGVVGEFWLSLRFLGTGAGITQAVSSLTAARLAFLLPLPGGLGALEAALALAARWMGWDPAVGIALSFLIRARDVFLAGLGGILWFFVFFAARSIATKTKKHLYLQERS
jgi:glycosyltransferase 2 family protein